MPASYPVAGNNAIEAAAFVFAFERPFADQEVEALLSLEQRFRVELPSFTRIQTLVFNMPETSAPSQAHRMSGVLLQHFRDEDGKPDWTLRVTGNSVVVTCHKYTSWAEVWPKARRFLLAAAHVISNPANGIVVLAMQYVDRFETKEALSRYEITDIFNAASPLLSKQALVAGPEWHVYQGWFENTKDFAIPESRLLNVVNITSTIIDSKLQTTIDHACQLRPSSPCKFSTLLAAEDDVEFGSTLLNDAFKAMHDRNVALLKESLAEAQLTAIGLPK